MGDFRKDPGGGGSQTAASAVAPKLNWMAVTALVLGIFGSVRGPPLPGAFELRRSRSRSRSSAD